MCVKVAKTEDLKSTCCCCSVTMSCLFATPMDCSTPGFPVLHYFLEFAQTCLSSRWCHPTISSSVTPFSSRLQLSPPPTFNLSQHQGFFQWVSSSHQVAKVLEFQLQHQSFQWIFRTDLLQNGLVGSPCSPRDSQESSPTPQFKSINSSVLSFLYSSALTSMHDYWEKTIALTRRTFVGNVSVF